MSAQFYLRHRVGVVVCGPRSLDPHSEGPAFLEEFRTQFAGWVNSDPDRMEHAMMVVDLGAVTWLHEQALDYLQSMRGEIASRHGSMHLARLQTVVRHRLAQARANEPHSLIEMCPTLWSTDDLASLGIQPLPDQPCRPSDSRFEVQDGVGVIVAEPDLGAAGSAFWAAFESWFNQNPGLRGIAVNLEAVSRTSGLVRLFATLERRTRKRGGTIQLARLQPAVRRDLEADRRPRWSGLWHSIEEAVAAAKVGSPTPPRPPPELPPEIREGVGVMIAGADFLDPLLGDHEALGAGFREWCDEHPSVLDVVVDLVAVRSVIEVAILIGMGKHLGARGGRLHLARPQPAVRQLLELIRLNQVFTLWDSVEVALAAVKTGTQTQPRTPLPPASPIVPGRNEANRADEPTDSAPASAATSAGKPFNDLSVLNEFHLECEVRDRLGIITVVQGGDTQASPVSPFRETVTPWLSARPEVLHLVLDWKVVSAIDDAWSSVPAWVFRQARVRGGRAILAGTSPCVETVLRLIKMAGCFQFASTVEEAIELSKTDWTPTLPVAPASPAKT